MDSPRTNQADAGRPSNEWNATSYDAISDPQARWGTALLDLLELTGNETVIDAGCGSGRVTEELIERLPDGKVIALDSSRAMLDTARERLSPYGERVSFIEADLLELGPSKLNGEAPVDAVFSTATFHWVTDHDRLFVNLASVLRRGGQLVAQCGGKGNIERLIAIVRSLGQERAGTWEYASAEATHERLEAAGFVDIKTWLHEEPTPFKTEADLSVFLETVCLREHVASMAADVRETFLAEVTKAMPERIIDYVRLNIVARRS